MHIDITNQDGSRTNKLPTCIADVRYRFATSWLKYTLKHEIENKISLNQAEVEKYYTIQKFNWGQANRT